MNPYYVDYMIKERRQMEIEECERLRMIKKADHRTPRRFEGFMKQLRGLFGKLAAPLMVRMSYRG